MHVFEATSTPAWWNKNVIFIFNLIEANSAFSTWLLWLLGIEKYEAIQPGHIWWRKTLSRFVSEFGRALLIKFINASYHHMDNKIEIK
jgi:hypothetical protein